MSEDQIPSAYVYNNLDMVIMKEADWPNGSRDKAQELVNTVTELLLQHANVTSKVWPGCCSIIMYVSQIIE